MTLPREKIVAEARAWIGTPYAHQASLIGVGCDCLGLVRGVWRACLGGEPEKPAPYAPFWPLATRAEPLLEAARRHLIATEKPQPGDVLLFRWRERLPLSHAAILSASDKIVHAHERAAVAEISFNASWRRRLAAVFSFPGVCD